MRPPPKRIAIIAFILIAILLFVVPLYKSWKEAEKAEAQRRWDAETFGYALEKDKQQFESLTLGLLFVSVDDVLRGLGTKDHVDMAARKQDFSAKGWADYQSYIYQMKADMEKLGKDSGAPYSCRGNFNYGSQRYQGQAPTKFSANGYFVCGAWDSLQPMGSYKLDMIIKGDVTNPDDLVIDGWNVDIMEPVHHKIDRKDPCVKVEEISNDILLRNLHEYQKKNGCE